MKTYKDLMTESNMNAKFIEANTGRKPGDKVLNPNGKETKSIILDISEVNLTLMVKGNGTVTITNYTLTSEERVSFRDSGLKFVK